MEVTNTTKILYKSRLCRHRGANLPSDISLAWVNVEVEVVYRSVPLKGASHQPCWMQHPV